MTDRSEAKHGRSGNVDSHVGSRLRMRRLMLGITREDLASAVRIGLQEMRDYEDGQNRVSANRLCRFAMQLCVPVTWFFEGLNDPRDTPRTDVQVGN